LPHHVLAGLEESEGEREEGREEGRERSVKRRDKW